MGKVNAALVGFTLRLTLVVADKLGFMFNAAAGVALFIVAIIVLIIAKRLEKRAAAIGLDISFDGSVAVGIAEKSYDINYGARPLRRTITTDIENAISQKFLSGELKKGEKIRVEWSEGGVKFSK